MFQGQRARMLKQYARMVMTRRGRAPFARLLVVLALAYLPVALSLTLLPAFLASAGHGSGQVVGAVIGAEAVTAMLIRPYAGRCVARRGSRIVFSIATVLIAAGTFVNAATHALALLLLTRLVLGTGSGAVLATTQAWAIELVGSGRRGRALGLVGVVTYLAVAAGPGIAALAGAFGGYDAAWLISGACALAAGALALTVPQATPRRAATAGAGVSAWRGVFAAVRPGLGVASAFAGYAAMASFAALALKSRGVVGGTSVLASCAVVTVAARAVFSGAADRFGAMPVALACAASQALGLVVLALAGSPAGAVAAGSLIGLGMANIYPALGLRLLEQARPEDGAVAIASLGAFIDLGFAAGAPIAGVVISLAGYDMAFVVMAIVVLAAVNGAFFDPPRAAGLAAWRRSLGRLRSVEREPPSACGVAA